MYSVFALSGDGLADWVEMNSVKEFCLGRAIYVRALIHVPPRQYGFVVPTRVGRNEKTYLEALRREASKMLQEGR